MWFRETEAKGSKTVSVLISFASKRNFFKAKSGHPICDVIHDGGEEETQEREKCMQINSAYAVNYYLCDVIHDGGEEERDNTMEVGVAVRTGSQPAAY